MQCLAGLAATRAALGLPAAVVDLPAVSSAGRLAQWANLNELLFTLKRGALPVPCHEVCKTEFVLVIFLVLVLECCAWNGLMLST
jgi:hypothetical protein